MNKKLIDNLLKNWPAKVICFTIAIFLYLFYQTSLIDKKTFTVPLDVISNGLVVPVGELPAAVVLSIKAGDNDIKSIFPTDIKASVNLNNIVSSGTYRVPIDIKISDKLMGFDPLEVKLREEKIKIVVERKISNFVKIVPSIVGEVAENYEINSLSVDPPYVQIEGPESVVNSISEIKTGRVNVSNAKIPFTVESSIMDVCDLVDIVDIKHCKVTVSVRPKVEERVFTNVPVKIFNLSENLEVLSMSPSYNITLSGDIYSFNAFNILKNPARIDLSGIEKAGEYEVPVSISVPDNFKLLGSNCNSVFIKLAEKKKNVDINKNKTEEMESGNEVKDDTTNGKVNDSDEITDIPEEKTSDTEKDNIDTEKDNSSPAETVNDDKKSQSEEDSDEDNKDKKNDSEGDKIEPDKV